ncbi:MAG: histidine phosphatase family protein [Desulfobulbus sp.]|nr:MAG: histidine phosphatase family protein [Desulfobulbus sp.]
MKQLLICRHAKSSWKDPKLADIDRPLNKRGKRDAPIMGERLGQSGMVPDLIICSPAKRARKTASGLCRGMQMCSDVIKIKKAIYDTTINGLLDVISRTSNRYQRLLLVGHNNELTDLVNLLAPVNIYNVPTCGIVGFQLNLDSWEKVSQVPPGAEFLFFDYPKKQHDGR